MENLTNSTIKDYDPNMLSHISPIRSLLLFFLGGIFFVGTILVIVFIIQNNDSNTEKQNNPPSNKISSPIDDSKVVNPGNNVNNLDKITAEQETQLQNNITKLEDTVINLQKSLISIERDLNSIENYEKTTDSPVDL